MRITNRPACFSLLPAVMAVLFLCAPRLPAAVANSAPPAAQGGDQAAVSTQAAAAVALGRGPQMPDFIEELADNLLKLFNIAHTGNSWERYLLAAAVLVLFYAARRLALPVFFRAARKAAGRLLYHYAEAVFSAVELPVSLLIMLCGVYVSVRTLKYPQDAALVVNGAAKLLFGLAFLWVAIRLLGATVDWLHEKAKARRLSIAPFMLWIRKSLSTVVFVVGALVIAQGFGYNVQTFLAGLGLGGLAFALAAQDTIANVFGAAVVAVDQPFRIGDIVQLAGHTGMVEDIGIRSMRLRRPDKALVVIPNKTVASEAIVNLSRFTNRRVEQVLGFTYDSTPAQMEAITREVKALIEAQPETLPGSAMVWFRDFNASSLDLWVVYLTKEPDFARHMELRHRLNLEFLRLAAARGLSFAFPTQTIDLAPSAAKALSRPGE